MADGSLECTALRVDPRLRRSDRGRTLLGGSPLRILRLSEAGAAIVDDLAEGAPIGADPTRQAVAARLVATGMATPQVTARTPADRSIDAVVPCRIGVANRPRLAALVASLAHHRAIASVTVLDDGSDPPLGLDDLDLDDLDQDDLDLDARRWEPGGSGDATEPPRRAAVAPGRAAEPRGSAVVPAPVAVARHDRSTGPGPARTAGAAHGSAPLVLFVDDDVALPTTEGWLGHLVAHLDDPTVALVAPRVRSHLEGVATSVRDRYEHARSPLDMGAEPASVRADGALRYVPSAMWLVRRATFEASGGFDPGLRYGEDVDLVWRLLDDGHTVRYEPSVVAHHRTRSTWVALARQRHGYGRAAAALDRRHPGRVAPVEVSRWSVLAWAGIGSATAPGIVGGIALAAGSSARLAPLLRGRVDHPTREALGLAGRGHLSAGRWLARAVTRTWSPGLVPALVASRRARRAFLVAAAVPALAEWRSRRPDLDPLRWVAACLLDDVAYATGVWRGAIEERRPAVLVPSIRELTDVRPRASRVASVTRRLAMFSGRTRGC